MGMSEYKQSFDLDKYLFELTGMKPKELTDLVKAKAEGKKDDSDTISR